MTTRVCSLHRHSSCQCVQTSLDDRFGRRMTYASRRRSSPASTCRCARRRSFVSPAQKYRRLDPRISCRCAQKSWGVCRRSVDCCSCQCAQTHSLAFLVRHSVRCRRIRGRICRFARMTKVACAGRRLCFDQCEQTSSFADRCARS